MRVHVAYHVNANTEGEALDLAKRMLPKDQRFIAKVSAEKLTGSMQWLPRWRVVLAVDEA